MGKTSKWLKSFLIGKKEREKEKERGKDNEKEEPGLLPLKNQLAPVPVPSPKEKKRWSFRRLVVNGTELNSVETSVSSMPTTNGLSESEIEKKRHAVAAATEAAADAAVAAAQAAPAVVRLTASSNGGRTSKGVEEDAAIKIQAYFRSYLARKALCALRGLVKFQALVRGDLVRRQANDTLRRMQALVTAQARARTQRIQMAEEAQIISKGQPNNRRSPSCTF